VLWATSENLISCCEPHLRIRFHAVVDRSENRIHALCHLWEFDSMLWPPLRIRFHAVTTSENQIPCCSHLCVSDSIL
jgi:hypothetical protein